MKRLTIIIPFFQRHRLTAAVFRHYRLLQERTGSARIDLLAVGSEGEASRRLASSQGLDYVECNNQPLDAKYDFGFVQARRFDPDAVCLVGSNDVITAPYFTWAMERIGSGSADCTGLLDCYLVDLPGHRAVYWPGYPEESVGHYPSGQRSRHGESIAAGRMFGRAILDRLAWRPFRSEARVPGGVFNDDETNIDLLNEHGAKIHNWTMRDAGCTYWNIKTDCDLNPLSAFEQAYGDDLVDVTDQLHDFWAHFRELE